MDLAEAQREFGWFRSECSKLRNLYNTHGHLFEAGDETSQLLMSSAGNFFHDLSFWMVDLHFIYVVRLTLGQEDDLTVARMVRNLQKLSINSSEAEAIQTGLESYGKILRVARNKLIGHLDAPTIKNGTVLGAHTHGQVDDFLESLQRFTDVVGKALGVGALDYRTQAGPGDVIDLLDVLERGVTDPGERNV